MVMKRVRVVESGVAPEPIPVLIDAPRYGAFVTGFSDYERRDGSAGSNIFYNAGAGGFGPGGFLFPGVNAPIGCRIADDEQVAGPRGLPQRFAHKIG